MQYAKPVTLNVEECDHLSFLPPVWQRFSVCRGVCVRAGAKNDAGISGRLLALHPPAGRWRFMMPDGDRSTPNGATASTVP